MDLLKKYAVIALWFTAIVFSPELAAASPAAQATITTTPVASGLNLPLYVTSPPGDTSRLFILEQWTGLIKILMNGQVLSTPFLNLSTLITPNPIFEQGLLCMAFHPNYATNRAFYVIYTNSSGNSVIARFLRSRNNPNQAILNSQAIALTIPNIEPIHNADWLGFGPDGYLYVTVGDDNDNTNPNGSAQDGLSLHGKILRVNVNGTNTYTIPPNNPFVGNPNFLPEIWTIGLRNPWRASFDRVAGDFYPTYVGADSMESAFYQPAGSSGGLNYGWNAYEGTWFAQWGPLNPLLPNVTLPIYAYPHDGIHECIIGGYVYRGSAIPSLQGSYVFGDYVANQISAFVVQADTIANLQNLTATLQPVQSLVFNGLSSFGENAAGELFVVCNANGRVYKIVPTSNIPAITLTPADTAIVIPATGGSFTYTLTITNPITTTVTFDLWIDALTQPYVPIAPQIIKFGLQLPGGATLTRPNLVQTVPDTTPAGLWHYRGAVGTYPGVVASMSWFTFTKSAVAGTDQVIGDWDLTGWDGPTSDRLLPIPIQAHLASVYPNPFNPATTIGYQLSAVGQISLKVFDTAGRLVVTLVEGVQEAGAHVARFDGSQLASGVYLVTLTAGRQTDVQKVVLMK